jgi:AcrR family transcriptional regulator
VTPPVSAPLPARERRSRQRAETRAAILEAAELLLVEGGYEAFSMRRLGDRCGCTAATLYHYFADKPSLIDELLADRFGGLRDLMRAVPAAPDPVVYLRDLVASLARFGIENPTLYRLLTMPVPESSKRPETAEQTFEVIRAPVDALHRAGRLQHPDPELVSRSVLALVHGAVSLGAWGGEDGAWVRELLNVGLDSILYGMLRSAPLEVPGEGQ